MKLDDFAKELGLDAKKIQRAFYALKGFADSGFSSTPQQTLVERESICHSCEKWDFEAFNKTGKCRECGCSTWAKLRMATERCPLGKWDAVDISTK